MILLCVSLYWKEKILRFSNIFFVIWIILFTLQAGVYWTFKYFGFSNPNPVLYEYVCWLIYLGGTIFFGPLLGRSPIDVLRDGMVKCLDQRSVFRSILVFMVVACYCWVFISAGTTIIMNRYNQGDMDAAAKVFLFPIVLFIVISGINYVVKKHQEYRLSRSY